ncbi:MAG: CHAT domain-containing protein [Saprospiraceae bacterium]|nr:CHAT domain-containing protein [Saprospiraceae bacterium]
MKPTNVIFSFCAAVCLLLSCNRQSPPDFPASVLDVRYASGRLEGVFAHADSLKYARQYTGATHAFLALAADAALSEEDACYLHNQLADLYLLQYKLDSSEWHLSVVQGIMSKIKQGVSAAVQADYWLNKGRLAFRLRHPKEALDALTRSLDLYEAAYPGKTHLKKALAHTFLGLCHYAFEKDNRPFYQHVETAYDIVRSDSLLWPYSVETELAKCYVSFWKRNFKALEAHAENVKFLSASQPYPDTVVLARATSLQGRVRYYLAKGNEENAAAAIRMLDTAQILAAAVEGPHQLDLISSYIFYQISDTAQFNALLDTIQRMEQRMPEYRAYTDRILGRTALMNGNQAAAKQSYARFLQQHGRDSIVSEEIVDEAYAILSFLHLQGVDGRRPQIDSALFWLGQIFVHDTPWEGQLLRAEQLLQPDKYMLSPYPFWGLNRLGGILLAEYELHRKERSLHQALRAFVLSDSLLFAQNPAYDETVILAFHREISGDLYSGALKALYALDSLHPAETKYRHLAAHFIDRSKSDVLFRFLPGNLSSDSLRVLKSRIDRLSAAPQRTPLGNRQLAYDLDAIENFTFNPKQAAYRFADVPALQNSLDAETAVLEYKICADETWLLYTDQQQSRLHRIGISANELRQLTDSLALFLNNGKTFHIPDYERHATALYDFLLRPFESELRRHRRWAIVPDGVLYRLPFEALITRASGGPPAFVVTEFKDLAVTYSPALKIRQMNLERKKGGKPAAGASFYNYGPDNNDGLVCSEKEWLALSGRDRRARKYMGSRCSKQAFIQDWQARRRHTVHLSLHGQADAADLLGAKIWFGPGATDVMYGFEIAHTPGYAEEVILSACETADGAWATGEGVYSMARSFFQAGACSVMATIWKVENCHNAHILGSFYAAPASLSGAQALADAKRAYLRSQKAYQPYYWAGMVCME